VRDLASGPYRIYLEIEVRRVFCKNCGQVKTELLDFLIDSKKATKRFASVIGRRCRSSTVSDVAKEHGLDWHTVKDLDKHYMNAQVERVGTPAPKVIGIDEIAIRKGHIYRIVVSDLVRRRPIWFGGDDRSEASMDQFYAWLGEKKAHGIRLAVMDMWKPFRNSTQSRAPQAAILFDKFHVIKNANEAVDKVRRAEVRLGGQGVWEALYKSQWLWRKNPENLTGPEQERLAQIQDKNLCTAKAYQMRLVLQDIYRSAAAASARRRFRVWCRWVRWVARFYKSGLFTSMVKLAQMIENHLAGILAHWKWGVTNAFMEGLNSVFSATKRKARGYRSTTHLITMLYFVAGKLRFPQFQFH